MKKNRMLRLASMLMILTLLTTSIVGGTFAKYVTTASGTDTARVAKWGVTIGAQTELFAESYNGNATGYTDKATVKVDTTGTNLVAPGTEGTGLGLNVGGTTPEVSYSMTIKLDSAKVPSLKYTPNGGTATDYAPVKFSVYNDTAPIKENMSLTDLTTLFNGTNKIYEYDVAAKKYYMDKDGDGTIADNEKNDANALTAAPKIQIKWEWVFEDTTNKALYNELDTILGDTAAAAAGATPIDKYSGGTISDINTAVNLAWTITATQID